MRMLTHFSGIVLAGGASVRMGVPKAFLEIGPDARPLISLVRAALADAGAPEIISIGGDLERLRALGFDARPDETPGAGPLGGLLTGLRAATWPICVVLSCDLPAIDAPTVRGLVSALETDLDADAAVPVVGGHRQVLVAAYRPRCEPALAAVFAGGERSIRRALAAVVVVEVDHLSVAAFVDLDLPADVANYARPAGPADTASAGPPGDRPTSRDNK